MAAQQLQRIGIGIEYDRRRYQQISKKLKRPAQIIRGDSRQLSKYTLPQFDFCFTSPPYLRSFDHDRPFTNYTESGDYKLYLQELYTIFAHIKKHLKRVEKPLSTILVTGKAGWTKTLSFGTLYLLNHYKSSYGDGTTLHT